VAWCGLFFFSHAGIVNVCRDIQRRRNEPIFGAVGCFHLGGLFDRRIDQTIDDFYKAS
jgi:metal-dependent hydrolase (beta-lactamase superfamily II)